MKYYILAVVALAIGSAAADSPSSESTREARDFAGYSSSPAAYDTAYDPASGSYLNPDKWTQPGLLLPNLNIGGCGSGSLVKPILAGLLGALLLKLPLLLAAKLLLLKIALPFGLLTAAAPVLLPLAYMLFNKKPSSSSSSQNDKPESRAFEDFISSSSCLEKIACTIGKSQARSDNVKTFSWMLKSVENMLGGHDEMRSLVGSYRSAYLNGAGRGEDGCSAYKCTFPEFFVRQGGSSYRLL